MNCPTCGKEMKRGKVAYQPSAGLHFLPSSGRLPYVITKHGVEKQGGIALDGPNNLGFLESDGALPAHICQACRKIVVEY
ncbi:PF20097 family protein [Dysosmobacter sp.]|uniref:PF20097 family protein n=1 Tax=Dysosmobacter sp. TaxID=2591382 RepID=UPI002A97AE91|nr:PF20097 family protein [Dysosmobacter sp.]MDY5613345.1 PF20097 family protein [Dysosmobacter sp.]